MMGVERERPGDGVVPTVQTPFGLLSSVICTAADHLGLLRVYYTLFWESRLIPRRLSGWGIADVILAMAACVLAWFSDAPLQTTYTVLFLPIAVQEMVLALWLIATGFTICRGST